MKRTVCVTALLAAAAIFSPALLADVKTREKTLTKFEGALGTAANMFGGAAARDGVTSVVAVKGNRLSRINDLTGMIIDLTEQKVYKLDVRKKEYMVTTFDEMRAQMAKARADAEKRTPQTRPEDRQKPDDSGKQMETEYDVKETGQRKTIAGFDAREVVMTITTHEKGRKIEDSGGFIMTNDMWIGPKQPAIDEIAQFELRYFKAVYGEAFSADMQQMQQAMAMYPSMKTMAEKMQAEAGKMQGTTLTTTTTFDTVKSAEQVKAAANQPPPSSGGGLGGFLGRKMAGGKPADPAQPRTTMMTTIRELLSVETSASAADVAIPAGYKEKK